MGVLFDYFAAADDASAGAVVQQGPADVFDTVSTQIDCLVALGYVEELLDGRPLAEQLDDPRTGGLVEQRADGEVAVLTISDAMRTALASAPNAELPHIARDWSQHRGVRRCRRSGRARRRPA